VPFDFDSDSDSDFDFDFDSDLLSPNVASHRTVEDAFRRGIHWYGALGLCAPSMGAL